MTENTQENQPAEDRDARILARAREIQAESEVSLVDAMIEAEAELFAPKAPELPKSFLVEIPVKPRVARWILATFGGHPEFTVEHRLGAFISQYLGRVAVRVRRESEPPPELEKGSGGVTMRREHMQKLQG